jgi:hypothetical protein
MSGLTDEDETRSRFRSWVILVATAVGFLIWGSRLYYGVGDKGPPQWDYSVIPDIPGQSPYSTRSEKGYSGLVPRSQTGGGTADGNISEQHVMEPSRPIQVPQPTTRRP